MRNRRKYQRWTGARWCTGYWSDSSARRPGTWKPLLAVAVDEFAAAEQQGITGYHLLWEIQKRPSASGWRGCSPPKRNGSAMWVRWRRMPR